MTLDVTINVWKEGSQYVAHALALDVMSSGPSSEAAWQAVAEALQCFLETSEHVGTLVEVLGSAGTCVAAGYRPALFWS